jgi:hypothetical protein
VHVVEAFREQAEGCGRLGSPMYADLLARVADDVEAGGPAADVLVGHEDDPGPSGLALRLAGSVHRLVLQRDAGALAASYPSVGGTWEPEGCWRAFRAVLAEQPDAVRAWLDRPPQTNEVGRASALMAGLLAVAERHPGLPVRLTEIGASGGLNLQADRFRYVADDGRTAGPAGSPVVLDPAWTGAVPLDAAWPRLEERYGTDVMPVDVATTEGRLALTAYVWPDQVARHERLRGALAVAAAHPLAVRRASALETVEAIEPAEGAVTVLWHSVMWQYMDGDQQRRVRERIDAIGRSAGPTAPFAHLRLEPERRAPGEDHRFWLVLRLWSGGDDGEPDGGAERHLARSRGHGLPTDWE